MCKWNDDDDQRRRVCVYWFSVLFFGRHQKTPFVTDKTWKTNVFGRVFREEEKETKELLTSTAHTNTYTRCLTGAKWPSGRNAFLHFVDRALLYVRTDFFSSVFSVPLRRWHTLLCIKVQSKPIAEAHPVHSGVKRERKAKRREGGWKIMRKSNSCNLWTRNTQHCPDIN